MNYWKQRFWHILSEEEFARRFSNFLIVFIFRFCFVISFLWRKRRACVWQIFISNGVLEIDGKFLWLWLPPMEVQNAHDIFKTWILEDFFIGAQIFRMVMMKWWVYKGKATKAFALLCDHLWMFNLHTFNIVRMWKVLRIHLVMCTKWKQFKINFFYEGFFTIKCKKEITCLCN
jgi:hypothetical protein